ncbi:hypothetical protein FA15DRAFT_710412 [Coprinopsis marcescibilis]|uniref:RNA ligase (ATP) n=1 Tax=Coprinopsis marcescibilis TaxID=230819 RepID=A0A5C3KCR1_COPMA|nr:hypothetical protein FA15DRAFT_710412 [Coprinopsis marcescibilis]
MADPTPTSAVPSQSQTHTPNAPTALPPSTRKAQLEDSALIDTLLGLSKTSPKLVKSTLSDVPGCEAEGLAVRSWKMNEFKYYDVPSPFPTLARGLFTMDVGDEDGDGVDGVRHRIVVRGYDKFFNIGEVPWTTWESIKDHTTGPYTLSLKSNGCIIFIAAITPSKVLVTSKHSVGSGDATVSHAMMGRRWLERYLKEKGREEKDLAGELWRKNLTAVAELCDDNFEEHVLAYPPDKTGLHLHGLNHSSKYFHTLLTAEVDAFAEEWGFIRTATLDFDTIEEVKTFSDEVAKTGKWDGEAVEGFVVRTHVGVPPRNTKAESSPTPYPPGSTFFFKIKYDEPYMMYRDWRELTKMLLTKHAKGERMQASGLPKGKMRREETRKYVDWVVGDIKRNPALYETYLNGKGIIATRERFLRRLEEGGLQDFSGEGEGQTTKQEFGKTVIVPVAVPGCGKTTVSLALAKLFGFGHSQSDNVQGKKAAVTFVKNVVGLLKTHDVVIADKNNHLRQHRTALREATSNFSPPVRLLALHFDITSKPPATIHRICSERIFKRGENHQTLRPDPTSKGFHEEVVWQFIGSSEELAPDEVDGVVDMDVEGGVVEQVLQAVEGVGRALGWEEGRFPSEERVREVVQEVLEGYKVDVGDVSGGGGGKKRAQGQAQEGKGKKIASAPRYFGVLPEVDLAKLLETELAVREGEELDSGEGKVRKEAREMFEVLKKGNRVTKRPHVTLTHKTSAKEAPEVWDLCVELDSMSGPPVFEGVLKTLVFTERVMALTFEDLQLADSAIEDTGKKMEDLDPLVDSFEQLPVGEVGTSNKARKVGGRLVEGLPDAIRRRLHVTIGTRDGGVAPIEGKFVVEQWREGEDEDGEVRVLDIGETKVTGLLKGLYS